MSEGDGGTLEEAHRRLIVLNAELTRRQIHRKMGRGLGGIVFLLVGSFFGSIAMCYLPVSGELGGNMVLFFIFMVLASMPLALAGSAWYLWSYRKLRRFWSEGDQQGRILRLEDEKMSVAELEEEKAKLITALRSSSSAGEGAGELSLHEGDDVAGRLSLEE